MSLAVFQFTCLNPRSATTMFSVFSTKGWGLAVFRNSRTAAFVRASTLSSISFYAVCKSYSLSAFLKSSKICSSIFSCEIAPFELAYPITCAVGLLEVALSRSTVTGARRGLAELAASISPYRTPSLIIASSSLARSVIMRKNSPPLSFVSPMLTPLFQMQTTTMIFPMSIFYSTVRSLSPEPSSPSSSNPSARISFCCTGSI